MASKKTVDITLTGRSKLVKEFNKLEKAMDTQHDNVQAAILDAAMALRDTVRANARSAFKQRSGTLINSVVAKQYSKKTLGSPAAFVAVDRRSYGERRGRKVAPYFRFLEFGTAGPIRAKDQGLLQFYSEDTGRWIRLKSMRGITARPMFRPAIATHKSKIRYSIRKALKKAIDDSHK